MKIKKRKKNAPTFALWEVLVITLVASIVMSISTGCVVYNNNVPKNKTKEDSTNYIAEIEKTYNSLVNNYYDTINQSELTDAAIKGMLDYLGDPYSTYLNQTNTDTLNDSLSGTYEGIGIQVSDSKFEKIMVEQVFENTPAKKAGIQVNDIINKIDGEDMTGKSATDAVNLIKNKSKVTLEILRESKLLTFELEKSSLYVPVVTSETLENNNQKVGYIKISKFSDTTYEQFESSLKKLEESKIDSLIIDVRNNTGGYLSDATNIAKLFLEKGKTIYSLQGKTDNQTVVDDTAESRKYKVYVIQNDSSASASEILAAALKYSYDSKLIGTKSYGKGKVQKTSTLSDGTMYKYTSAKWLTPNGDCIDEVGLVPDMYVELSEEYAADPSKENDNQLQTALHEITK